MTAHFNGRYSRAKAEIFGSGAVSPGFGARYPVEAEAIVLGFALLDYGK